MKYSTAFPTGFYTELDKDASPSSKRGSRDCFIFIFQNNLIYHQSHKKTFRETLLVD